MGCLSGRHGGVWSDAMVGLTINLNRDVNKTTNIATLFDYLCSIGLMFHWLMDSMDGCR